MGQEYNNLNKNSKCQQIQNDNGCVALKRRYKDKDKNKGYRPLPEINSL